MKRTRERAGATMSGKAKRKVSRRHLPLFVGLSASVMLVFVVGLNTHRMPSRSMENTVRFGDHVLSEGLTYGVVIPFTTWRLPILRGPRQGDVVVFRSSIDSSREYLKRCVAVAGQTVEIRNKAVYVDGKRLADPPLSKYIDVEIHPAEIEPRDNLAPTTVPPQHLFVIGDNRDNSRDSRHWGPLASSRLVGRALYVFWSPARGNISAGDNSDESIVNVVKSLSSYVCWTELGGVAL